jgi:hypothetical protein
VLLSYIPKRQAVIYQYFSDKYSNKKIENTIPENPQFLAENEAQKPAQKNQDKDVSNGTLGSCQDIEAKYEEVIDEIGDESNYS